VSIIYSELVNEGRKRENAEIQWRFEKQSLFYHEIVVYTVIYIYSNIVLFNIASYTDVIVQGSTWCLQEDVIIWQVAGIGAI